MISFLECADVCVFLYLEHPCSSTPDQRRGVNHPIPQNSQQQFVVRWVGAKREYNYFVKNVFFKRCSIRCGVVAFAVLLTPAPRRTPSGCPGVRGTETGLSSRPPGSPPATCDPPPAVDTSVHRRRKTTPFGARRRLEMRNAKLLPDYNTSALRWRRWGLWLW